MLVLHPNWCCALRLGRYCYYIARPLLLALSIVYYITIIFAIVFCIFCAIFIIKPNRSFGITGVITCCLFVVKITTTFLYFFYCFFIFCAIIEIIIIIFMLINKYYEIRNKKVYTWLKKRQKREKTRKKIIYIYKNSLFWYILYNKIIKK